MSDTGHVCRYSEAERAHVEWVHLEIDANTWTCYHHARVNGPAMSTAGWARVTDAEWLPEENRLQGAL
jgi:hypothetical protein